MSIFTIMPKILIIFIIFMENNKLEMFHCLPYIQNTFYTMTVPRQRADLSESAQYNRDREKSRTSRKPQRFVKCKF